MATQIALDANHPFMVAWKQFTATAEYANALKWALAEKYDDGREISTEMRKNHVDGAMWLAFTRGLEEKGTREWDVLDALKNLMTFVADGAPGTKLALCRKAAVDAISRAEEQG